MDIAQVLFDRRIELGITQATLAKHCGFKTKGGISLLESGQRQWKFKDILSACELLELRLAFIESDYCPNCNLTTIDYATQSCVSCGARIRDYIALSELSKHG